MVQGRNAWVRRAGGLMVGAVGLALGFGTAAFADVEPVGSIEVTFAGNLVVQGPTSVIEIPGIKGSGAGQIEADGSFSLPKAGLTFPEFDFLIDNVLPASAALEPTSDWNGAVDPETGLMVVTGSLLAKIGVEGLATGCPVGPIGLNFTTGSSGAVTGKKYDPATGKATVVDGTFPIPAIQGPGTAACGDVAIGVVNDVAGFPLEGGKSTTTLVATITPKITGSGDAAANVTTTTATLPPTTAPPATAAVPPDTVATQATNTLPRTGTASLPMAAVAVALVGLGGAFAARGRLVRR